MREIKEMLKEQKSTIGRHVQSLGLVNKLDIRKRSWSKRDEPPQTTSKAELHQNKTMLSVWFLPIMTRNSMSAELRSYQKYGKNLLNKMENISLIKVHSL